MKRLDVSQTILKDIRTLQVLLIHPADQDREELTAQLVRIGCRYECAWPHVPSLPTGTDLVLLAVRPETLSLVYPWMNTRQSPPVIPVVAFENPITLAAVLHLDAFTTIASPVRPAGLLTALAITWHQSKERKTREHYIQRLEQKAAHQQVIQKATKVLMESRGVSEAEAYELLRSRAMLEREQIEVIARRIVKASATLNI